MNSQSIPVNQLTIVKEKRDKSLVIVNKGLSNPTVAIANKSTKQVESVQKGTLSKE